MLRWASHPHPMETTVSTATTTPCAMCTSRLRSSIGRYYSMATPKVSQRLGRNFGLLEQRLPANLFHLLVILVRIDVEYEIRVQPGDLRCRRR